MTERRPGDPAVLVSSNEKAVGELGWDPRCSDLNTIVETACNRHKQHLEGY
jgi:UDP-glucose 4-epimerase